MKSPFGLKFKIGDHLISKTNQDSRGIVTAIIWNGEYWFYTLDWYQGTPFINLQWADRLAIESQYEKDPSQ